MKVSDLHQHPHRLFTAQVEETLDEAADRMNWHQVGALPVFDGQQLVGIITERDLTAALAEGADPAGTPVSEYMTPAPTALGPDSELVEAAHRMLELGVRHLPVLRDGNLVGVLSIRIASLSVRTSMDASRCARRPGPGPSRIAWGGAASMPRAAGGPVQAGSLDPAVRGVHTGLDAAKVLLAGADVAMMTSALLRHGPGHDGTVERELTQLPAERDHASAPATPGR
jgi:predicted transcriptional regulator